MFHFQFDRIHLQIHFISNHCETGLGHFSYFCKMIFIYDIPSADIYFVYSISLLCISNWYHFTVLENNIMHLWIANGTYLYNMWNLFCTHLYRIYKRSLLIIRSIYWLGLTGAHDKYDTIQNVMDVQNAALQLCVVPYLFSVSSVWISWKLIFLKILSPIVWDVWMFPMDLYNWIRFFSLCRFF